MTAQAPDLVVLDGVEHALVGAAAPLFDPRAAGLAPSMIDTGCWRGSVCWYDVRDGRLRLARLVLGRGTTVRGEPLRPGASLLGGTVTVREAGWAAGSFEVAPALPIAYTGSLLVARDLVGETYVHLGHQAAWQYATVVELVVADGEVRERRDRSAEHAETRRRVLAGEPPWGDPRRPGP